jgi:hypothetical protein
MIIIIYVDDLIILANNMNIIDELKSNLEHKFEMNNLSKLHSFI